MPVYVCRDFVVWCVGAIGPCVTAYYMSSRYVESDWI